MTRRTELWAGRRVALRPVTDQDIGWLYQEAAFGRLGEGGRFGTTKVLTRSEFVQRLEGGSDETLLAFAREDPERRLGLVQLYNYDERDGVGYLAMALTEAEQLRAWPMESILLFVNYLFSSRPLRKLYFQGADSALASYRSLIGRFLTIEAHQVAHQYSAGLLEDVRTLSLTHETWAENQDMAEKVLFGGE